MTPEDIKNGLFYCATIEDFNLYKSVMNKMSRKQELNFTFSEWFDIDQAVRETEETLNNKVLH